MFRKILFLVFAGLITNWAGVSSAYPDAKEHEEIRLAQKVKIGVSRLGTGEIVRAEVKLHDKTKLIRYVKEVGEDTFVLVDTKTGASTIVYYSEVKQLRANNLSTGEKIAIGLGVTLGALFLLWVIVATSD